MVSCFLVIFLYKCSPILKADYLLKTGQCLYLNKSPITSLKLNQKN